MTNKNPIFSGFTLIELLVVIVIIGILATISTGVFSGYRAKGLAAKYQAERVQASKERYGECLDLGFKNCGPTYAVYSPYNGGVYRKNINSPSDELGDLLVNVAYADAITPDGKNILYSSGGDIYIKDIHDLNSTPIALTYHNGSNAAVTLDGEYLLYMIDSDSSIYKKALDNTDLYDIGDPVTSVSVNSFVPTPDGLSIIYSNQDEGSRLYKTSINGSGQGKNITDFQIYDFAITPDGEHLVYWRNDNIYKKSLTSASDDFGIEILDLGSESGYNLSITPDGEHVVYTNYDTEEWYKKSLSTSNIDTSDPGTLFADVNGGSIFMFP